jgi:hypothetical protein
LVGYVGMVLFVASATVGAGAVSATSVGATRALAQPINWIPALVAEVPVPADGDRSLYPYSMPGIAAGPDGNVWFTLNRVQTTGPSAPQKHWFVGRITPSQAVSTFEYSPPKPRDPSFEAHGEQITTGPTGDLRVTFSADFPAMILGVGTAAPNTISAVVTKQNGTNSPVCVRAQPLPSGCHFTGITTGPDHNMWVTEPPEGLIARITPDGAGIAEFSVPGKGPWSIVTGPDNNLWFTESPGDAIGRITPAGVVTQFPLSNTSTGTGSPAGITVGPDGKLWFTDESNNSIGTITTTGVVTEFPLPNAASVPNGIATGCDGNLWFSQDGRHALGRITPTGGLSEVALTQRSSAIAAGGDGKIYATEFDLVAHTNSVAVVNPCASVGSVTGGPEYVPLVPARLLESRTDPGLATVDGQSLGVGVRAPGSVTEVQVTGRAGVPADASAVVLNVTVTGAQGPGYVTVYPCGGNPPNASNLNYVAGSTVPNAVVTKIGAGGKICLYTQSATDLIADINGYFPAS